jgi:hypothetical protein
VGEQLARFFGKIGKPLRNQKPNQETIAADFAPKSCRKLPNVQNRKLYLYARQG